MRRISILFFLGAAAALLWCLASPHPAPGQPDRTAATASPTRRTASQAAAQALRSHAPAATSGAGAVAQHFPDLGPTPADWTGFDPETLTVAPYPDIPIRFSRFAVKREPRYVTWIGRNDDLPGASLVGIATQAGYDAVLVVPGASQFHFHVRGERVVVIESDPAEEHCLLAAGAPPEPSAFASPGGVYTASRAGEGGEEPLAGGIPRADTAVINVDLLVAYDESALAYAANRSADPVGFIDARAKGMVESANLVFLNSGVTNFQWRYLGAVPTPSFPRTGKFLDDLNALTPGGVLADWAQARRREYGADQLLLFVGTAEGPGGRAAAQDPARVTRQTAAYSVAVINIAGSYHTLAHELAHNFGCGHDRANYRGTGLGVPDGDGNYNYGLLFMDKFGTKTGTIMAYGTRVIPYFSNPNITVNVTSAMEYQPGPSIDLGTYVIGYPESDPKAAYNSRVLAENAAAMAANAEEVVVPSITRQPEGATVVAGSSLTLAVSAAGGGLQYQWFKGETAISGATSATYLKSSWLTADAGSYRVQVSNRAGIVESLPASITVTGSDPVVAPPVTPVASGGGGGGGGAPSLWFLSAWGLLLCLRRRRA